MTQRHYFPPHVQSVCASLKDIFVCPCGLEIALDGPYLAAHWKDRLVRICDQCGQKYDVEFGVVSIRRES